MGSLYKIPANHYLVNKCAIILLLFAWSCNIQPPRDGLSCFNMLDSLSDILYEIHFIDVGQGDAILIITPESNILVDGGLPDSNLIEYLDNNNIDSIALVVATHPHADHIGGLIQVINEIPVGRIIDPGIVHSTATYNRYLTAIDNNNIPYAIARKGEVIPLGKDASATIIHPDKPDDSFLNDASVVLLVNLGQVSVLLTGDIESLSENKLIADSTLLKADIIKVPHHGSSSSLSPGFLRAVEPDVAIIMCGYGNPYGNPHRQTLALLNEENVLLYRTDIHGSIVVKSDGIGYCISTERVDSLVLPTIDINTASIADMQIIVHIGAERAAQIVKLRPFLSLDDLINVDGIGPIRLEDIKKQGIAVVNPSKDQLE